MKNFYLKKRFFLLTGVLTLVLVLGYLFPFFFIIGKYLVITFGTLLLVDALLLFRHKHGIEAERSLSERFSNGDHNEISIPIINHYPFDIFIKIIDELPYQFQLRDQVFYKTLKKGETTLLKYDLVPKERGIYEFGHINVFAATVFGLVTRRFRSGHHAEVKVYPSFLNLHQYELAAISNKLKEQGIKKIRRIGHTMEFEQIKEYITGDDPRTINWKATARRNQLMSNHFQDEKSQHVYALIDKGRTMKMPFNGMSLLDYAINTTLVFSNIAIKKDDKSGLISYHKSLDTFLPASKKKTQIHQILETLYKQQTVFPESDISMLYFQIRKKLNQRSLLFLFTNFESMSALKRQMPYLLRISRMHRLIVIFFENVEVKTMLRQKAKGLEEIYQQTIAENYLLEKRMMVNLLHKNGIMALLTSPKNLTIDTINKYLEIKSNNII